LLAVHSSLPCKIFFEQFYVDIIQFRNQRYDNEHESDNESGSDKKKLDALDHCAAASDQLL
jgi:hypothetical protein